MIMSANLLELVNNLGEESKKLPYQDQEPVAWKRSQKLRDCYDQGN